MPTNLLYWLAALRLPNMGPKAIKQAVDFFGDIASLFTASFTKLQQAGLTAEQITALQSLDYRLVEKDWAWCDKHHCQIILYSSAAYPKALKETSGAPLILFVRGDLAALSRPQIAVVGSRAPSHSGQELAKQFAFELAKAGLVITSGLALGIDAAGHQGALKAEGQTIAVLGNGMAHIYPKAHAILAEKISAQGALVSEFLPYEPPKPTHFPRRNRIISGLSLGALVIEAALKSGSLITARYAADQGREVFAVPGSLYNPLSRGCHYLIKQGAKLVENTQDILDELNSAIIAGEDSALVKKRPQLDKSTQQFLACIGHDTVPFDVIMFRSGLTTAEVSSMLLTLELEGLISRVPGGYRVLVS